MAIRVCVTGATGWTGSAIAKAVLAASDFKLSGAVSRRAAGRDIGEELGLSPVGVRVSATLEEALHAPTDVVIDYTTPNAVKAHVHTALSWGVRVVIGTSGLTSEDYAEIEKDALSRGIGVIAAGNFSITAALAKHFSLLAAKYLPSWEIVDYADARKLDAPSGTVRELAEEMGSVKHPLIDVTPEDTLGSPDARGAGIAGTRVHSVRLPSYVIAFETIFGRTDERLTIRHDAGSSAEPYVAGTLLAAKRVVELTGLVRGLDRLLFETS